MRGAGGGGDGERSRLKLAQVSRKMCAHVELMEEEKKKKKNTQQVRQTTDRQERGCSEGGK